MQLKITTNREQKLFGTFYAEWYIILCPIWNRLEERNFIIKGLLTVCVAGMFQ